MGVHRVNEAADHRFVRLGHGDAPRRFEYWRIEYMRRLPVRRRNIPPCINFISLGPCVANESVLRVMRRAKNVSNSGCSIGVAAIPRAAFFDPPALASCRTLRAAVEFAR